MSGRPVFVGGCPRSGTTLLRTMLNSHPDLALPRETRFVLETWARRAEFGDLSEAANRRRLARSIFRRRRTHGDRLEVRPRRGVTSLIAAPPTIGSLLGTCFALYAESHGKARWGDKRPMYVLHLDAIFAMFPDAQFINLVRDPRSVVASIRKLGWFGGDVVPAVDLWERSVRAADAWRDRLRPDQFLDVRYEDLVSGSRDTLRRVCDFLRLDPRGIGKMLAFHETNDVPENRYHWQVSRPASTASLRGWEKTLSRQEIALVEHANARTMRRYGYPPVAGHEHAGLSRRRALAGRRLRSRVFVLRRAARGAARRLSYRYPVAAVPTADRSAR
jgi:sulfotransferase family protein